MIADLAALPVDAGSDADLIDGLYIVPPSIMLLVVYALVFIACARLIEARRV